MKTLLKRFKGIVNETLSGFDRIAFKGFLMPLMYAKGVMDFCRSNVKLPFEGNIFKKV